MSMQLRIVTRICHSLGLGPYQISSREWKYIYGTVETCLLAGVTVREYADMCVVTDLSTPA